MNKRKVGICFGLLYNFGVGVECFLFLPFMTSLTYGLFWVLIVIIKMGLFAYLGNQLDIHYIKLNYVIDSTQ